MADWFVAQPHNTITGDGTEANPWRGFRRINWSVINEGDTLWVLGSWIGDSSYSHGGYAGSHCGGNPLGNLKIFGRFSSSGVNVVEDTINIGPAGLIVDVGASLWFRPTYGQLLPEPLVAYREYYVHSIPSSGVVKLSETPGGDPIDLTTQGTGTLEVTNGGNILKSGITIRGDRNPNNIATARWVDRVFKTFYNTGVNNVLRMTTNYGAVSIGLQIAIEEVNGAVPDAYERPMRIELPAAFEITLNAATDIDVVNDTISANPPPPDHTRIIFRIPPSGTTLPGGMSAGTLYYVVNSDPINGKFKISTTRGGGAINLTSPPAPSGLVWCRSIWEEFYPADVNTTTYEITLDGTYAIDDAVVFETSGTLPTGLLTNTRYYVVSSTGGKIKVSTTKGGSPQAITTQGSGNHRIAKEYRDEILNMMEAGQMLNPGTPDHYRYYKPIGNPPTIAELNPGRFLRLFNLRNVTIKNLNLWGGIEVLWCEDITIENVNVKYAPYATMMTDCVRPIIRNSTCRWCNNGFYYYGDFIRDGIIEDCVIEDTGYTMIDMASEDEQSMSYANPVGQCYIRNCIVRRGTNGIAIYLDDDASGNPIPEDQRLDAYNNYVEDIYCGTNGHARYGSTGNKLVCSFPLLTGTAGRHIWNRTTGATGTVVSVTHTHCLNDTVITNMSGGTRTDWQVGDAFCIVNTSVNNIHGAAIDIHGAAPKHPNYVREVKIYNNIVLRSLIGGRAPVIRQDSSTITTIKYYNNIFWEVMCGIRWIGMAISYNAGNFHSRNNIFYLVPSKYNVYGLNSFYIIHGTNLHADAPIDINNNCYWHSNGNPSGDHYYIRDTVRNRAYYLTWVRQNDPNQETSAVMSEPKVNSQDMKLLSDSPCRRAGAYTRVAEDYFGNPRFNEPGGVCIGAHEKWDNITTNIGS